MFFYRKQRKYLILDWDWKKKIILPYYYYSPGIKMKQNILHIQCSIFIYKQKDIDFENVFLIFL